MTASAKGDAENPSKKVKQKSGINKVILNVSFYKIREKLFVRPKIGHTGRICRSKVHITAM